MYKHIYIYIYIYVYIGKTQAWKTLAEARNGRGEKTKIVDINPKSVKTEELYGFISMATREWKDGLLSKVT
jgi:dynein heavy chain